MRSNREHAGTDRPHSRTRRPGATPIEDAYGLVRTAMSNAVGLLDVAEAAAVTMMQLMSAWEISITLLDGDDYWDIVDVSVDPSRGTRFPDHRYPLADFPIGTSYLLDGRGYVGGEAIDEVLVEYGRQWPEVPVGSIMSAPILALDGIHGEVFLVRDRETSPFTGDELRLASECAALLGARLPALVAAYQQLGQTPDSTMHQLSETLATRLGDRSGR